MKARIDKIFSIYYSKDVNKFVAYCRIKVDKEWRFERLFYSTEEEVRELNEGQFIDYGKQEE